MTIENCWMAAMVVLAAHFSPTLAEAKPIIVFNEDSDNLMRAMWHKDPAHYTEGELRDYMHRIVDGGKVSHFFACVNARVSAFPSKVETCYWETVDDPAYEHPQWLEAMKDLVVDQGVDQFKVYFEECRKAGVSPWASIRMNDIHFPYDKKNWLNCGFWKEHPELWINPASTNQTDGEWSNRAYDYRKEGVQQHYLKYLDEVLARYDVDGVELDWMRFEWHAPKALARTEGGARINDFMRKAKVIVRRHEKLRGHRILIAGRVDTEPESALNHGTDYRTWVKEGLVDWLIVCNFWLTADFKLPFKQWAKEVRALNDQVTVIPGIDCGVMRTPSSQRDFLTPEEYAGWADLMFRQGAKGLYFFNLFCRPVDRQGWDCWDLVTKTGLTPETVAKLPKSVPPKAPRECVLSGYAPATAHNLCAGRETGVVRP